MKKALLVAVLAVAAPRLAVAGAPRAAKTLDEAQLTALTDKLQANAKLWLEGKEIDPAPERELKGVVFDVSAVDMLNAELNKQSRAGEPGLYVLAKLLHQLTFAKADVVQGVYKTVKGIHLRTRATYRKPPAIPKAQEKAYEMPDYSARLTTEAIMKAVAVVEARRDQKVQRELPLARHNELVYSIEKSTFDLALMTDDPQEDKALVALMLAGEKYDSIIFLDILDAIASAARKMGKERAAALYEVLKTHGLRLKMANKRGFDNPGEVIVSRERTSDFAKKDEYPGVKLLEVANRLATAAKEPAINVPDRKKIEEFYKKQSGKK